MGTKVKIKNSTITGTITTENGEEKPVNISLDVLFALAEELKDVLETIDALSEGTDE